MYFIKSRGHIQTSNAMTIVKMVERFTDQDSRQE